ncbi:MAG TPA: APC family permease, partial [Pseudomonadales bacterium]|nr:APC family permease [Pseudomonadales bacterium]
MDHSGHDRRSRYHAGSLTLTGAVAMGTGVMIGAGIFALTGQLADHAGAFFPLAFVVAAVVTALSAHAYVRLSATYPSAGGIAMFLEKAYGRGAVTATCGLLMYFSMVINEALVARTFGTYVLQFGGEVSDPRLVATLGVGLLLFAFGVNVVGNRAISAVELVAAMIKIAGIGVFAFVGLWLSGGRLELLSEAAPAAPGATGFLAAVALGILAYKGFTTITNSGAELRDPERNVGRAIVISIAICTVLYALVALAVSGNL